MQINKEHMEHNVDGSVVGASNILSLRGQQILTVVTVLPVGMGSNKSLLGWQFQISSAEISSEPALLT